MDLEILKIASDTRNHKVLKDSSHFAKFKNPLCGDEMNVSLMVKDDKITDFACLGRSTNRFERKLIEIAGFYGRNPTPRSKI